MTFNIGKCTLALHSGYGGIIKKSNFNIVFEVEDIESVRKEFCKQGVEMSENHEAAPGISVYHGHDPEGNPFSITMIGKYH